MTKYILHGGATGNKTENNRKFFFAMTDGLPDPVKVLCVYFAREKESWPELFEQDKINFSSAAPATPGLPGGQAAPRKVLNLVMADEDTDIFVEQIKKADVIYLRGGDTRALQNGLKKVRGLENLCKGKVVAGASAGALVLAKYYYENDRDIYNQGLGLLPIKAFCHYTEKKVDKLEKLKKYGEELKVYAIPEEKFFVIQR